jgi:hypothetical protein
MPNDRLMTASDEQEPFSAWVALPGGRNWASGVTGISSAPLLDAERLHGRDVALGTGELLWRRGPVAVLDSDWRWRAGAHLARVRLRIAAEEEEAEEGLPRP